MAKFSNVTSTLRPLPPWYERQPPAVQPRVIAKAAAQNKELEAALEKLGGDIMRLHESHGRLLRAAGLLFDELDGQLSTAVGLSESVNRLKSAIDAAEELAP